MTHTFDLLCSSSRIHFVSSASPLQWPAYFDNLLSCLKLEHNTIDMYLRILSAIDKEVVDREMNRNETVGVDSGDSFHMLSASVFLV